MNQASYEKIEDVATREIIATALGWNVFPYVMPGPVCKWCPPGAQVHISTAVDLPSLATLTAEAAELRAEVGRLRGALQDAVDNCLWRSESPYPLSKEESQRIYDRATAALTPTASVEKE
jgi:hypothetical protein